MSGPRQAEELQTLAGEAVLGLLPAGEVAALERRARQEAPLAAACREFSEETGFSPAGPYVALTPIRQRSGKVVHAWAFAGDCDPGRLQSNTFTMEWPPHSGQIAAFPEVDRAAFFSLAAAREKINPAQIALLDELERLRVDLQLGD